MDLIGYIIDYLSRELAVLLISAIPIIELRGAIPIGISLGLNPIHSAILSFVGSILPVPVLLIAIRPIFKYLRSTTLFKSVINSLTSKSMKKSIKIQKHGFWGLVLFVAIPLPGTGVWSGTLAAALLDMRIKLALPAILIGNLIAMILILILSNSVFNVCNYF